MPEKLPHVTCESLAGLVSAGPERVAVLVLLRDVAGKPAGEIQFVTWGRALPRGARLGTAKPCTARFHQTRLTMTEIPELTDAEGIMLTRLVGWYKDGALLPVDSFGGGWTAQIESLLAKGILIDCGRPGGCRVASIHENAGYALTAWEVAKAKEPV